MTDPMSDERLAEIRDVYVDDHDVIGELLAEVERLRGERKYDDERTEYAINLLIAIASPDRCMIDSFKTCIVHGEDLSHGGDCPHALARAFLAGAGAWSTS